MGLFAKTPKPVTARSPQVRTLYEGLSEEQRRHVRQMDIDLLEGSLRPGESVEHISVTHLRPDNPQPIAITNERMFHFQGHITINEFALSAVVAHEVVRMKPPQKGYGVHITGGDHGNLFVAPTEAAAIAFEATLGEALDSAVA